MGRPVGLWTELSMLKALRLQTFIFLVTLVACELILRIVQPQYLEMPKGFLELFRPDPELGWLGDRPPLHNSLGLRDVEYEPSSKPAILFIGDSMVWGIGVEERERFTELLRSRLPDFTLVNAGINGYGTDQEYLLLRRLWDRIRPNVVMLTFCVVNDRADNSNNVRYAAYKPYFELAPDGTGAFRGQPVPLSRQLYFRGNWLAEHSWVARLVISAYVELRNPRVRVPDPTERLLEMIQNFIQEKGATLLVGLTVHEPRLEAFLKRRNIPFSVFNGAEVIVGDNVHWSPAGHALVADRTLKFFSDTGVLAMPQRQAGSGASVR
jgi:lysophospholipase L1-like esterase